MLTPPRAIVAGVLVGPDLPVVVMGAINVSPESFYAGSVRRSAADAVATGLAMAEAGAALIDVGARSTAPYLPTAITEAEEGERLVRAVEVLAAKVPVPISADTTSAAVARAALDAGARVINDVSGLRDPAMARVALDHGAGLILMASPHMVAGADGPPTAGTEPIDAVKRLLALALARARRAGIADEHVVLDPGIGFFRDEALPWHEWDVAVLARLGDLGTLGRPLCVAVSRKSFIGAITGRATPDERLAGSLAATAVAVLNGAALIRTHDLRETLDAVRVAERVRRTRQP